MDHDNVAHSAELREELEGMRQDNAEDTPRSAPAEAARTPTFPPGFTPQPGPTGPIPPSVPTQPPVTWGQGFFPGMYTPFPAFYSERPPASVMFSNFRSRTMEDLPLPTPASAGGFAHVTVPPPAPAASAPWQYQPQGMQPTPGWQFQWGTVPPQMPPYVPYPSYGPPSAFPPPYVPTCAPGPPPTPIRSKPRTKQQKARRHHSTSASSSDASESGSSEDEQVAAYRQLATINVPMPKFDGGKKDPDMHISKVEHHFRLQGRTKGRKKIQFFPLTLEGVAYQWWDGYNKHSGPTRGGGAYSVCLEMRETRCSSVNLSW